MAQLRLVEVSLRQLVMALSAAVALIGLVAAPTQAATPTLSFAWADAEQREVRLDVTDAPGAYVMFRLYNPALSYLTSPGYVDSSPVEVVDGSASGTISMFGLVRNPKAYVVSCTGPSAESCDAASLATIQFFRSEPWPLTLGWEPEMFYNPDQVDWTFQLEDSIHAPSVKVVVYNSWYTVKFREIPISDGVPETVDLGDWADGDYAVGVLRCSQVNPAVCTSYTSPFYGLLLRRTMALWATGEGNLATPNGDRFADVFRTSVRPDGALPEPELSWRFLAPDKTPVTTWQPGTLGEPTSDGRRVLVDVYPVRKRATPYGDYWVEFRTRATRNGFSYESQVSVSVLVAAGQSLAHLDTTVGSFNPYRRPRWGMPLDRVVELATVRSATLQAVNRKGHVVWTRERSGNPVNRYASWDHPRWYGVNNAGARCRPGKYRLRLTMVDLVGNTRVFTTGEFSLRRTRSGRTHPVVRGGR